MSKYGVRYYMGRHEIIIVFPITFLSRKVLIKHIENGFVGNKREGYKKVYSGQFDITSIRLCRKEKRD